MYVATVVCVHVSHADVASLHSAAVEQLLVCRLISFPDGNRPVTPLLIAIVLITSQVRGFSHLT